MNNWTVRATAEMEIDRETFLEFVPITEVREVDVRIGTVDQRVTLRFADPESLRRFTAVLMSAHDAIERRHALHPTEMLAGMKALGITADRRKDA